MFSHKDGKFLIGAISYTKNERGAWKTSPGAVKGNFFVNPNHVPSDLGEGSHPKPPNLQWVARADTVPHSYSITFWDRIFHFCQDNLLSLKIAPTSFAPEEKTAQKNSRLQNRYLKYLLT